VIFFQRLHCGFVPSFVEAWGWPGRTLGGIWRRGARVFHPGAPRFLRNPDIAIYIAIGIMARTVIWPHNLYCTRFDSPCRDAGSTTEHRRGKAPPGREGEPRSPRFDWRGSR